MNKKCPQCNKVKVLEVDFPRNRSEKGGIHCWCLECCRASNKKVYARNKAHYIEKSSTRQRANGNKYQNSWQKNNPVKYKFNALLFRCKRSGIPITSQEEFISWYNAQPKICFYCGVSEEAYKKTNRRGNSGQSLNVDKIIPKNGYIVGNMNLACATCNSVKSDAFSAEQMKEIAEKYITPYINSKE